METASMIHKAKVINNKTDKRWQRKQRWRLEATQVILAAACDRESGWSLVQLLKGHPAGAGDQGMMEGGRSRLQTEALGKTPAMMSRLH